MIGAAVYNWRINQYKSCPFLGHKEQVKKQLREATARVSSTGLKSATSVLLTQSILVRGALFLSIALQMVDFLQLSSYWALAAVSTSMRWKQLLQLPVRIVLPSGESRSLNASYIDSLSTISPNFDFKLQWIGMELRGLLGLATSQILTERQSLLTKYFPFLEKVAEEMLETASKRRFLCLLEVDLQVTELFSTLEATLRSPNFREPLLMPQRKMLSCWGCISQQLISSQSSTLSPAPISQTMQGRSARSMSHRNIWESSVDSRYCSLLAREVCFMWELCLTGKLRCREAVMEVFSFWRRGMDNSLLADLTTFFSAFSQIFQRRMLWELAVMSFLYLPWRLSQLMSTKDSSISELLSESNWFQWAWNSVKYSKGAMPLWSDLERSKMMILPALSPTAIIFPSLSYFKQVITSSSRSLSVGFLQPKIWLNLQEFSF